MRDCRTVSLISVLLFSACQSEETSDAVPAEFRSAFVEDEHRAFRDDVPVGPARALAIRRRSSSALDIVQRARAMAVVITGDESLPGGESVDMATLAYWEKAARGQPGRPGTINVYFNGHNLSATYLPMTDTLLVLSKDVVDRAPKGVVPGQKSPGVGVGKAQFIAEACVDELAKLGAIPAGVYSRKPIQSAERVTVVGERVWVEQYDFVFAPKPGGVPLRSMDIRVGVAAQSGRCRSLAVSMVDFEEQGEVVIETSAETAKQAVRAFVSTDPIVSDVAVEGYVGYLLEPGRQSGLVEPRYIAEYVTTTLIDGQPLVSREKTVAVVLTSVPPRVEPMYDW